MALVDLCKVQVLSTGTGPLVLGSAVAGFDGIGALTDAGVYSYAIQQDSNWEYGTGTYVKSSGTLIRSPIKSSYGLATAIDLSGGAQVTFTVLAEDLVATGAGIVTAIAALNTAVTNLQTSLNTILNAAEIGQGTPPATGTWYLSGGFLAKAP